MTTEHITLLIRVVDVILLPLVGLMVAYLSRIRASVETTKKELHEQLSEMQAEVRKELRDISEQVHATNGRLRVLEDWRKEHSRHSAERDASNQRQLEELRRRVQA